MTRRGAKGTKGNTKGAKGSEGHERGVFVPFRGFVFQGLRPTRSPILRDAGPGASSCHSLWAIRQITRCWLEALIGLYIIGGDLT
jgi:hypothetical protein